MKLNDIIKAIAKAFVSLWATFALTGWLFIEINVVLGIAVPLISIYMLFKAVED